MHVETVTIKMQMVSSHSSHSKPQSCDTLLWFEAISVHDVLFQIQL